MTTYTEPTITVTDWRGDDVEHTMASYQEVWETSKISEVIRLAKWQLNEEDVNELEALEAQLAEVRERVVRREFLSNFKRQNPERNVGAELLDALIEEGK
jgi:hypothetical protein